MFKLILPGGITSSAYYDANNDIKFDPPVYEQRYSTALRILENDIWEGTIKKVGNNQ